MKIDHSENKDFAVFILTHGRPDNVWTKKTLDKCGYKGLLYFVLDDEDKTLPQYQKNFGKENIIVFNKKEMADSVDEGNNFDERRTITHARNACFKIAEKLGITYFLQLDDDYYEFIYKFLGIKGAKMPKDIDKLFDTVISFYKKTNCLSIAFAQTGDFIGGIDNGKGTYRFSKRKCMNSFFCSTERPFQFIGAMNEDVNTYTTLAHRGELFLTIPVFAINQKDSQTQKGGITDMYLKYGTYCKAFTTTMMHPSGVKVSMMRANNPRLHHSISWNNTTPMIISKKYQKTN
jgi:hypothetical protein